MKTTNTLLKPLTVLIFNALVSLLWVDSSLAFECTEVSQVNHSQRLDCSVETSKGLKTFHVLKLRGNFERISYDHAYLLATEAQSGLLQEVTDRFTKGLNEGGLAKRKLKSAILNCYQNRIIRSVSKEFVNGVDAFYDGLKSGLKNAGEKMTLSYSDVRRAPFGIDLSNATDGLEQLISENPLGTYTELLAVCGLNAVAHPFSSFKALAGGLGFGYKFGCLGMAAPDSATSTNGLLHARNLDADLVSSWNKSPALFLIEEPGYYKYVAAGTAGNIYPGGISGFNEKGISVSLHQMSTTKYRTRHSGRKAALAPFVSQRVLREAATINEAIAVIKSIKHFAAWTVLITDAKTNEVASVEFSGDRVQVARRVRNKPMAQSNHFLGSQMQDQFFLYSFNKKLETHSRIQVASQALSRDSGQIDIQWMINQLAGHEDAFQGFRSFGRTNTKIYTVMSTIAAPKLNQFWLTLGDQKPASHSQFLGFQIDFNGLDVSPLTQKRVNTFDHLPNWETSLSTFSDARLAYESHNLPLAEAFSRRAIHQAMDDGIKELPYHYIRGRLLLEMGRYSEAHQVFEFLYKNRQELHTYQQAMVALLSAAATNKLGNRHEVMRRMRATIAKSLFKRLNKIHNHFDLKDKIEMASDLINGKSVDLGHIHFVTVE